MISRNTIQRKNKSDFFVTRTDEIDDDVRSGSTASETQLSEQIEAFLAYEPKYTAEQFDKQVCAQLKQIKETYDESEERILAAIEMTEDTMKVCDKTNKLIEKTKNSHEQILNSAFFRIGRAIATDVAATESAAAEV